MKRVFVIAMESEAVAVTALMEGVVKREICGRTVYEGAFGGERTAVIVAGIGKVNAAAGAQMAIDRYEAEKIVNVGVAGGISPGMKVAEVYSIAKAFQSDFDLSEVNGKGRGTPDECDGPYFELETVEGLPTAICATADFFGNADCDYAFVHDEMGASLREMELGAIAHVAKRAGVGCLAIKAVSDLHFPGCGKPTDQYAANLKLAVAALTKAVERLGD